MPKSELNPDNITLEDVQGMSAREFRQYTFLKLNGIDHNIRKLDSRLWYILISMVSTILLVLWNTLV